MKEPRASKIESSRRSRSFLTDAAAGTRSKLGVRLPHCCILIVVTLLCGCSGLQARAPFQEAHDLFEQGDYAASLHKYEQIGDRYPNKADRVLFEKGLIYSHPKNEQLDLQKSLECFERLLKDYPESAYRQDTQMMVFYLHNAAFKDQTIGVQRATIEALKQEAESGASEIVSLQERIKELEQRIFIVATRNGAIDKILILKQDRRLMLMAKDEVVKTYKIALGGDPNGPKQRQGDNKTPEGTYFIDSRNKNSHYHLSLHISYPNETDKKKAKELGVSPGGNIMIHGIKNGFSWVGDAHTQVDWTKGCIAVTDEEIEEIARVVPNGTTVEIRP